MGRPAVPVFYLLQNELVFRVEELERGCHLPQVPLGIANPNNMGLRRQAVESSQSSVITRV